MMTLNDVKTLSEIFSNLATVLGLLVGGSWVWWKFGLQREAHAKIEFDLELEVLGREAESLLVEIAAKVTNKGLVRHNLTDFRFDLLYLPAGAELQLGDERINRQVLFTPIFKRRYWIPPDWISTFIDPGVSQRYTYVASAPGDASYLLVLATFRYPEAEDEYHTAQKVWSVKQTLSNPAANPALHADSPQTARR